VGEAGRDDRAIDLGCVNPCTATASPTWLSNKRIAFTRVSGPNDPTTGNAASVALYTARIDGGQVRRLSEPSADGVFEDAYLRVAPRHRYLCPFAYAWRTRLPRSSASHRTGPAFAS
jgi:hypothetical protein